MRKTCNPQVSPCSGCLELYENCFFIVDGYSVDLCPKCRKVKKPVRARKTKLSHGGGRLYRFGITEADLQRMFQEQEHKCKICTTSLDLSDAHIDHCHQVGTIRGLLCLHCNLGIGHLRDRVDLLEEAIRYLKAERPNALVHRNFRASFNP